MKIMIVDDEPFYIDHLKEVIENSRFSASGEDPIITEYISATLAIEAIIIDQPDLIFTDIRMQFMSGIELATTIREKWPHIIVVIVSGYSSFDYARDAIRANVDDYLNKPVDPYIIDELLNKINIRIYRESYLRQQSLLNDLLENKPLDTTVITAYKQNFPFASYTMFFYDKKSHFIDMEKTLPHNENDIQNKLAQLQLLQQNERVWNLTRNGLKNGVIILGLYKCDSQKIKQITSELVQIIGYEGCMLSIAVSPAFNELTKVYSVASQLHDELYHQLVIGQSKEIYQFEKTTTPETSNLLLDSSDERKLKIAVEKKDWKLLRRVIAQWFSRWEQVSCPNLFLKKNLKQILQWLEKYFHTLDPLTSITTEKAMDDLIDSARSFQDAADESWNLLSNIFQLEDQESNSDKGIRLIEQITDYLSTNLSEPITMTQIIDRFQISSTHLGNLFRKYVGKTFVEYITTLRIDKAKELMRNYPDMPLKEIAEIVGFADRHYFTKVFKLVTGKPPTEFRDQLQNNL